MGSLKKLLKVVFRRARERHSACLATPSPPHGQGTLLSDHVVNVITSIYGAPRVLFQALLEGDTKSWFLFLRSLADGGHGQQDEHGQKGYTSDGR